MKCAICGADVPVGRFIYCSDYCQRKAQRTQKAQWSKRNRVRERKMPAEATCPMCGNVFNPKPNEKYCSYECKYQARHMSFKLSKDSVRICAHCGKEFEPKIGTQKCCSRECSKEVELLKSRERSEARRKACGKTAKKKPPAPPKSLAEWCKEARECNLDYGNYRALIASGKTFEELRAQADNRCIQIHAHGRVHSTH